VASRGWNTTTWLGQVYLVDDDGLPRSEGKFSSRNLVGFSKKISDSSLYCFMASISLPRCNGGSQVRNHEFSYWGSWRCDCHGVEWHGVRNPNDVTSGSSRK